MANDLEHRIRGLVSNYQTRDKYNPEPRPTWFDIQRDLREALGESRQEQDRG